MFSCRRRSWSGSVLSVLKSSLSSLRRYADSDWQLIRVLGSSPSGTHTHFSLSRIPVRLIHPQYSRKLRDFNDPVSHLQPNKDCWYPAFFNEAANSCRVQLQKVISDDLMSSVCKFSLSPASLFALLAALLLATPAGSPGPNSCYWLDLKSNNDSLQFSNEPKHQILVKQKNQTVLWNNKQINGPTYSHMLLVSFSSFEG